MREFTVPKAERKPDPAYSMTSKIRAPEISNRGAHHEFASLAEALQNASAFETIQDAVSAEDEIDTPQRSKASIAAKWKVAADKGLAQAAARKARLGQKKRSLNRTPLHMILQRLKQLIERRESLVPSGRQNARALNSRNSSKHNSFFMGAVAQTQDPPSPRNQSRTLMSPRIQAAVRASGSRRDLERMPSRPAMSPSVDMESIIDEICVTLQYMADFYDKLPEETCMELARHVRMETANKEQILARNGDEAFKFCLIITGNVEKSPNLRQEGRFNPAQAETLKRADHFGSDCILKRERHSYSYCAMNSVTMLVIDREPFRTSFGRYIRNKQNRTAEFLSSNVEALKSCDRSVAQYLAEVAEEVILPPTTEFDMLVNNDVYFLLKGQVNLMSPKVGGTSTKTERGKNRSSKARDEAIFKVLHLDNETDEHGKYLHISPDDMPIDIGIGDELITVFQGQAFSTFGTDFKRSIAETQETMKIIAQLQLGTYFGGGAFLNGEDPLLSEVKAFVPVESTCLKLSASILTGKLSDDVVQLLRNEAAFQLTYYLGRQGVLDKGQVVGHETASIFDQDMRTKLQEQRELSQEEQARAYMSGRKKKTLSAFQQTKKAVKEAKAQYMKKANEAKNKNKGNTKDNFKNKIYTTDVTYPVDLCLKFKSDQEDNHIHDMEQSIVSSSGTPVERYWGSSGSKATHQTKMLPLLTAVFPSGLGPLSDKVMQMEEQESRVYLRATGQLSNAWGEGSSAPASGSRSPEIRGSYDPASGLASSKPGSPKPGASPPASIFGQYKQDMAMRRPSTSPSIPGNSPLRPASVAGSLNVQFREQPKPQDKSVVNSSLGQGVVGIRAAGLLWDQMQDHKRPYVRQCLTFAEIAKFRNEDRRQTNEVIDAQAKHDEELRKLKEWNVAKLLVGTTSGAERHLRPIQQQQAASGQDEED